MSPPAVEKALVFLAFPTRDARSWTIINFRLLLLQTSTFTVFLSENPTFLCRSLFISFLIPASSALTHRPRACLPQTIALLWQRLVGVCWTTQDRKSRRKMYASSSSSACSAIITTLITSVCQLVSLDQGNTSGTYVSVTVGIHGCIWVKQWGVRVPVPLWNVSGERCGATPPHRPHCALFSHPRLVGSKHGRTYGHSRRINRAQNPEATSHRQRHE